jgi:dCTP deaminase
MSVFSDRTIRAALDTGIITIKPFPDDQAFQPASVDLRLGEGFIDVYGATIAQQVYTLYPNAFILASTLESVTIPNNIIGRLDGKSSLGRLGIAVHITAGFCDPGFSGRLTLEIKNMSSRVHTLTVGMYICQIEFSYLTTPVLRPYGHKDLHSQYQDASGVQKSTLLEK